MTDKIAVGKCRNCGYVVGDEVNMIFPRVADCEKCGAELEKATVKPKAKVEELR